MNKLKVLCDVDGVLNDFQNHFLQYLDNIGITYDSRKCDGYHLERCIMVRDKKKVIEGIFSDDYFWTSMIPIEHSLEGLEYLNIKYDLYIATTPWNEHNKDIKTEWLLKYYPFLNVKQIIFSDEKWKLNGDIIIEDKPTTITKCGSQGMITVTKFQPYNMDIFTDEFLYTWSDIKRIMDKIEAEHFFNRSKYENYN